MRKAGMHYFACWIWSGDSLKLLKIFNINNKGDLIAFVKQTAKYGLVGLFGTMVSFAIYYAIIWINKDIYIFAYTMCFIVGVLISYFLHNRFVFKKTEKGHKKPLMKAYITYGTTYLLSITAIYVMVEYLDIAREIAPLFNLFITVPVNYLLTRFWTFKW